MNLKKAVLFHTLHDFENHAINLKFSNYFRRGRFIFLGSGSNGEGLIAFTAARNAVEGCATALREELKPFGVSVVTLDSHGVPAEALFKAPMPFCKFFSIYFLLANFTNFLLNFSHLRLRRRSNSILCRSAHFKCIGSY